MIADQIYNMEDGPCVSRLLDETFLCLYAKAVLENIDNVSKNHCYGCAVNHLSQSKHECIMWKGEEKLSAYFSEVVDSIDDNVIVDKFCDEIARLPIPKAFADMYSMRYKCNDWRNIQINSIQWQLELYQHATSMIKEK
ncbi:hypothetical protein BOW52_09275 [Solemya elarraichensis gill symbiont]|uniref:Uncharacterized protein n=1 Tax=Solemya elarraichensis gill symbiont TaxID=1918949 RepID=A0A1T2KZH2_9GAMM|nr:hypothetical protein BOW52_09275 [Solemya elarraichensis gill symbiont]